MSNASPKLRLLVISSLPNDAEELGSHLRNAGFGARTRWCDKFDKAMEILEEYHANLILCDDSLPDTEFTQYVQTIHSSQPSVPVLALGESSDHAATTRAMGLGASDRIMRSDPDHMKLIVSREYRGFCQARDLNICQARMAMVETRHDVLLNSASEPIAYVQEGILTRGNPAYAQLMGVESADDLKDLPIMDLIAADGRDELKKQLKACAKGEAPDKPVTLNIQRLDGDTASVDFYFSEVRVGDEEQVEIIARAHGPGYGASGSNRAASGQPADHYAMYEALKQACDDQLEGDAAHTLYYIAIDAFDKMQAEHGFAEADQTHDALQALLNDHLQPDDQFFRFASGELIVLGRRDSIEAAEEVARQWSDLISQHDFAAEVLPLTASIVSCPLAVPDIKPHTVLRRSRETVRMMADKPDETVHTLGIEDDSGKLGDQYWLKFIKQALRQDDLELNYQSIASLEGEQTSFFEVTVRMLDEHKQELRAGEFMPTAEKHGLMEDIDRWVIGHALGVLKRYKGDSSPQLFIKLSEDTLKSEDFIQWLGEQAEENPSLINNIVFEAKTPMVIALGKQAVSQLKALKKLGAMLALEQVNADADAQKLLKNLPLDFFKLDIALTEQLGTDDSQTDSINRIMENAREKKIKSIAEHVEKANNMATLWQFGVNYIQGHYVQEPEVELVAKEAHLV